MCESPQQHRYTLESLRQREASPLGYSHLPHASSLTSLPVFPLLVLSPVQQSSCHLKGYVDIVEHMYVHTHTCWQSNNNLSSLKPSCCFVTRLSLCFSVAAAAAHSQVAEIDSLSKWHDTQLTVLSTSHADLTIVLSQRSGFFFCLFVFLLSGHSEPA